jgi:hypothetical protein
MDIHPLATDVTSLFCDLETGMKQAQYLVLGVNGSRTAKLKLWRGERSTREETPRSANTIAGPNSQPVSHSRFLVQGGIPAPNPFRIEL